MDWHLVSSFLWGAVGGMLGYLAARLHWKLIVRHRIKVNRAIALARLNEFQNGRKIGHLTVDQKLVS